MRSQSFPLAGQRAFLEIFGPLLAHNIDVYHPRTGRYGILRGLPACYEGQQEPLADVEFYADAEAQAEGCGDITEPVAKILPVLYSFEDLATEIQLPDGRRVVPAVEVAKLSGGHSNIDNAEFSRDIFGNNRLSLTADGKHCWSVYKLSFTEGTSYSLREIELLRQWHFAVGLSPEQYHRKQVAKPFEYLTLGEPLPLVTPCPDKRNDCPSGCPACPTEEEVARA
jgi:hypothetical protein